LMFFESCVGLASAGVGGHVTVLSDAEAWRNLPPAEEGFGQPLPVWIRALARSLPKTAAAMIELDYRQRAENPLPAKLRAKLRWMVASANRCEYAKAYARADYVRAGGRAEDIDDLPRMLDRLPEAEQLALQVVRQLAQAAYTVTDAQMRRLVELYGEKQVVAIVLVAAYANFQDRLLLALGVSVEPGGPLPPIKVRFHKQRIQAESSKPGPDVRIESNGEQAFASVEKGSGVSGGEKGKGIGTSAEGEGKNHDSKDRKEQEKPKRKLTPPVKHPPPVPDKVDDPEWTTVSLEALRKRLAEQRGRSQARISIPDSKQVLASWPDDVPRPDKEEMRIKWCLLTYGYQPRLTAAWLGGLDVFQSESDLDPVFHESMFWVVTRSLQCFY
jgi:alkylhydroperoxidase family enzyme